jgi:hypothetical protein
MRITSPPIPTCEEAAFIRGTAIFAGNITSNEAHELNVHALHCERADWYHALLHPATWPGVERERERLNK